VIKLAVFSSLVEFCRRGPRRQVRSAAPQNGASLTAPGRGKPTLRLGRKSKNKRPHPPVPAAIAIAGSCAVLAFSIKILHQDALGATLANSVDP